MQRTYTQIVFDNQENATRHNPYEQERREVAAIRSGDTELLRQAIEEDYVGSVGTLADTLLRSDQNLGIVLITLASRAAMEGGVDAETAYSLSDSYIRQIEQMQVPEAAIQLARKAEFQYAGLVQERKRQQRRESANQSSDPRIVQCKDYIFAHLHEKIQTSDIAEALHISPNYLANLFRKTEGKSITEFITGEKVRLVKNLLIYSDHSYSMISTFLGFASQSHMGRIFKRETGMTPAQYRNEMGVVREPDKE